jgi:P-type E1-E2 ATPase
MIELNIPGSGLVQLEHLVCDVNGTLAVDGKLIEGVARSLGSLQDRLSIHLVTADTFGRQSIIDQQLNLRAVRLQPGSEAEQKSAYVEHLTAARVAAIGQGANDALMLRAACIGICVLSLEGAAAQTLAAADVVVPNILAALGLFENPLRLIATLRK